MRRTFHWTSDRVVDELRKDGSVYAIRLLFDALRDERLRWKAAGALGEMKPKVGPQSLLRLMRDNDTDVRRVATWLAGEIGHGSKLVLSLIEMLDNENENVDVRRNAAIALGKLGSLSSRPALMRALQDKDVRWSAAQGISKLRSEDTVSFLVQSLKSGSTSLKVGVTWALRLIRNREALPALIDAIIYDPSPEVVKGAIWAVRQVEPERVVQLLIGSIDRDDQDLRQRIVGSLSRLGTRDTIERLHKLLPNASTKMKREILDVIEDLKARLEPKRRLFKRQSPFLMLRSWFTKK